MLQEIFAAIIFVHIDPNCVCNVIVRNKNMVFGFKMNSILFKCSWEWIVMIKNRYKVVKLSEGTVYILDAQQESILYPDYWTLVTLYTRTDISKLLSIFSLHNMHLESSITASRKLNCELLSRWQWPGGRRCCSSSMARCQTQFGCRRWWMFL